MIYIIFVAAYKNQHMMNKEMFHHHTVYQDFFKNVFISFINIDLERFSGKLKERAVKDKMGCSFYF